jgi:hypothetical protein
MGLPRREELWLRLSNHLRGQLPATLEFEMAFLA